MDLNEINFDYNDNSNNNFNDDMLLLSERNGKENNRYIYIQKNLNKKEYSYFPKNN